jgi:hypothetical protein
MKKLTTVKLKNSLKSFVTENSLIQQIIDVIKTYPNYASLKNDLELYEHVCTLIENNVPKNNSKAKNPINKKKVFISVVQGLFPNLDLPALEKQVDYFIDNNLVKRKSFIRKSITYCKSYFKKSFQI